MAEQLPPTDQLSSLVGSQRDTYQTLIAMGFAASDSVNVAQIFGSNVEGAIDSLFNANVDLSVAQEMMTAFPQQDSPLATLVPPPPVPYDDAPLTFRTTSLSQRLMSGYVRDQNIPYHIPAVINDLIIRYFNLYFIKLNYNIHNDDIAMNGPSYFMNGPDIDDTMDQKHSEDATDVPMAIRNSDSDSDDTDEVEIDSPFIFPIWVVKSDVTLRDIAIRLEKSYRYCYETVIESNEYFNCTQYQYFVHLWMRFRFVKAIYPIDNKHMKISMDGIHAYEADNAQDPDRWVEIPNDFEESKISVIDRLFAANASHKHCVLELGVERFDRWTEQWPFRNQKMVPLPHEIVRPKKEKKKKEAQSFKEMIMHALKVEETQTPQDWNCAFCGRSNDKTYVICAGCFKDKPAAEPAVEPQASEPSALVVLPQTTPPLEASSDPLHPTAPPLDTLPRLTLSKTPPPAASLPSISELEAAASETPVPMAPPGPPSVEWTKHLKIGDIVDAKDEQDKWYESVIRCIESNGDKKLLYLHYIGWNKKWDEPLLAQDSKRIAKRNTHTIGPHRPKRSQYSTKPSTAYPHGQKALVPLTRKLVPNTPPSQRHYDEELANTLTAAVRSDSESPAFPGME